MLVLLLAHLLPKKDSKPEATVAGWHRLQAQPQKARTEQYQSPGQLARNRLPKRKPKALRPLPLLQPVRRAQQVPWAVPLLARLIVYPPRARARQRVRMAAVLVCKCRLGLQCWGRWVAHHSSAWGMVPKSVELIPKTPQPQRPKPPPAEAATQLVPWRLAPDK